MKFTIFGASGFIGRNLVRFLEEQGHEVNAPARGTQSLTGKNLGHVMYAIGMTGNFREKPQETIDAHVYTLQRLMKDADFDSWLYLSSARIYQHLNEPATEDAVIKIKPGADGLYDISKLLGESLCLSVDYPNVRVARLSNAYGADQSAHTFLGSIFADLETIGTVTIGEHFESSKDYISIKDVVALLPRIATSGKERLYNVASGQNIDHQTLAKTLESQGFQVNFKAGATKRELPPVSIEKITKEFGFKPKALLDELPNLIVRKNK